jgi:L-alanine-DL-glutamate epimerase-like enolase superfamily enzyme
MVLSGIEDAVWDILGKALGVPVHVVLGGAVHSRPPMYASGGEPTFTIDQLVQQAKAVREAGFLGYKMRANFLAYQPEVEAERVDAVRAAVGPDRALALDAVQSSNFHPWSVKQAAAMLERLAPYGLAWADEMLPPFDPMPYAELRRATSTTISGGEGITTAPLFEQWLRAGAFDLAQPDATIIGGIGEARRACETARAYHVRIAMHVWGSAPTIMAKYNLAFTQPNCIWLERPAMSNPLEEEMLVEPLRVESGYVLPPTAPGLGVKLTPELKATEPTRQDDAERRQEVTATGATDRRPESPPAFGSTRITPMSSAHHTTPPSRCLTAEIRPFSNLPRRRPRRASFSWVTPMSQPRQRPWRIQRPAAVSQQCSNEPHSTQHIRCRRPPASL